MKLRTLMALGITMLAIPAYSLAEVSVSAGVDYTSRYIWRGFDFYDDGAGIQPGASVAFSTPEGFDITFGLWANYDVDNTEEWDEIDYSVDIGYSLSETTSLSFGGIIYDFPEADITTEEIYIGATTALPADLEGSATLYYDFDENDGYYLTAGLSYGMDVSEKLGASLSGSVGYLIDYADIDGFSDISLAAGLDYAITDNIGASCSLNYVITPEDDVNEDDEFFYMVGIAAEF